MSIFASVLASSLVVNATPSDFTQLEDLAGKGESIRGFTADGSGCAVVGDPIVAGDSITLILVDYVVEKNGVGFDRASCDLAVEVSLPQGVTISLDSVVYRGFADGFDSRSTFYREYFMADKFIGDRRFTVVAYDSAGTPTVLRDDSDDYMSDYGEFKARDLVLNAAQASCGGSAVYRTNTSLSVRNPLSTSSSYASIDTVDVHNQYYVTFEFGLDSCDF